MNKYKIAEIAIEFREDGTPMYWVYSAGDHADQDDIRHYTWEID